MNPHLISTNIPGIKKNKLTGVMINTNEGQLRSIQAQRKKLLEDKDFQKRVERLEADVALIKQALGMK